MPTSVYSTLFTAAYVTSAAQATAAGYTVPAGKVAVVRNISLLCGAPGVLYVGRQTGGVTTYLESTSGLVAEQSRHWRGDQVYPAGHLIRVVWVAGGHNVTVSGFLFNIT